MDLTRPGEHAGDLLRRLRPNNKPSEATLAQLLDLAFFASLLQDEGRTTKVTLALVAADTAARSSWDVLRFRSPVELTPQVLRRLAPAAAPDVRVFLGVEPAASGGLQAWGFAFHDGTVSTYLETGRTLPMQGNSRTIMPSGAVVASTAYQEPPNIRVRILKAGDLLVKQDGQQVLLFHAGRPIWIDHFENFRSQSLVPRLIARLFMDERAVTSRLQSTAHREARRAVSTEKLIALSAAVQGATVGAVSPEVTRLSQEMGAYFSAAPLDRSFITPAGTWIQALAAEVTALGHGGTILVLPRNVAPTDIARSNALDPDDALKLGERFDNERLLSRSGSDSAPVSIETLGYDGVVREVDRLRLGNMVRALAHLSAVDGAVVLDADARPLSFGTFLSPTDGPAIKVKARRFGDEPKTILLSELEGGTRHRSAVAWCATRSHPALALIASQDGTMTVAWKWPLPDRKTYRAAMNEPDPFAEGETDEVELIGPFVLGSSMLDL